MRVAFPDGCLDVRQNDVFVLYLQIERNQPASSAVNKRTIQARSSGGKITIDSVILVNVDSTSTGSGLVRGFICGIPGDPLANNVQITNACALNFSHPTKNYTAVRTEDANGNHVVSNCCLINSDINMDVAGTSTISKNNVFQDGGTDVVGTLNPASDYNLTDAGSFPVGSNNVVNSVLTFINKAGNDFHLAESDTDAIRAGIGPSVDLDIPDFDVDGDSRAGDDTDIGYDHLFIEPGGTGARTWYHFFLGLTGLNSISFNDKAVEYLKSKGVSSTTLNGALNEWLGDKGYTGSLDDRIKQWGDDDFPE
jgi:hypothetical protein